MHVLIVDDNEVNRKLPLAILRLQGMTVDECSDGESALAFLQNHRVDCILLDVSMPGISGIEVCRRLRGDPRHQGIRIVAYTAHAYATERSEILDAGFDALLVKPIRREDLLGALGLPV